MNGYQIVSEALIFDEEDFQYHVDDWKSGKNKLLLITGFSAAGKSTLGKKLAKEYNTGYASMDDMPDWLREKDKAIRSKYKDPIRSKHLRNLYVKYAKDFINKIKKPMVWEGIQMYAWLPDEEIAKHSVIIMGTSYLTTMFRAMKQFAREDENFKEWFKSTKHFAKMQKYMIKELDHIRNYLKKIDKMPSRGIM